jgi:hypothetical protein
MRRQGAAPGHAEWRADSAIRILWWAVAAPDCVTDRAGFGVGAPGRVRAQRSPGLTYGCAAFAPALAKCARCASISDKDERVHASRGTALFRLVLKRCYRQPLQPAKTVLKRALAIT